MPRQPNDPENPPPPRHPGHHWRRLMFDAHLTQSKVAARIGITPKHLSAIVTGKALPSVDVCRRFAAAVGADAEQLWAEVADYHLHDGNQRTVRPGRAEIDGSAEIDGM